MVAVGTDDVGTKPGTDDVTQVEGGTNAVMQTEGGINVLGGSVQGRARSPSAPQRVANGNNYHFHYRISQWTSIRGFGRLHAGMSLGK